MKGAGQPNAMIRDRDRVRFTADEIDQFRSVGLDATGVRMRITAMLNGNSDDVERDWRRVAWPLNFSVGVQHRVGMVEFLE